MRPHIETSPYRFVGNAVLTRTFIVWLVLLATASCSSIPPSLLLPKESWDRQIANPISACTPSNEKNRLIVFVHGVLGDATSTWRPSDQDTDWPSMLLSDAELNGANKRSPYEALVFSYKTTLVSFSSNITEVAVQLRAELEKRKAFEGCEQIYFVTHSMGGLVTKRMLLSLANEGESERLARVRALFFIGTPTYGSKLGSLAKWLTFNPQFQNMEPMDINTYLQTLDHDWQAFLRKRNTEGRKFPLSFCAYEATPTFSTWVVDRVSAAPNCDATPLSVDKVHMGIVKPESRSTEPYPMVKKHILEISEDPFIPNRRVVLMDSAYPWKVYDLETQRNGGTNADDIIPILEDTNLNLIPIKELVYPRWADLPRIKELNPGLIVVHLSSFSSFSTSNGTQDAGTKNPRVYSVEVRPDNVEEFRYFLRNALEELPQTRFLIYSRLTQEQKEKIEQVLDSLQKELAPSPKPDKEQKRKRVMLFAVCPTNGRGNNPSKHSFRDPITRSVFSSYVRSLLGDQDTPQNCPTESPPHTGTTGDCVNMN